MQIKTGFKLTKPNETFKTWSFINEKNGKASIKYEQTLLLIIILPSGQKYKNQPELQLPSLLALAGECHQKGYKLTPKYKPTTQMGYIS